MKRNKFIKKLGMLGIHLLVLFSSWLLSFITTSFPASLFCFVMSIVKTVPQSVADNYWKLYLIGTIPLTVVFFILIERGKDDEGKVKMSEWKKQLDSN